MPSEGASGGLIFVYGILKMEDVLKSQWVLAIKFNCIKEDFSWIGANVHGPNDESLRDDLWALLSSMFSPWVALLGDFNVVRFPREKKGGRRICQCMV